MSETRFIAAYAIDISSLPKEDVVSTLKDDWGLPVLADCEEDGYVNVLLDAPWRAVAEEADEGGRLVLQYVVKNDESVGGESVAFNTEKSQKVLGVIHSKHPNLFAFLFKDGYCALTPVAYTYYNGADEPIVI